MLATSFKFPGVKRTSESQSFYYDDNDVNMFDVQVGRCQGDYVLSPAELKSYFGVEEFNMGRLPRYLIMPRLNSTSRARNAGQQWWNITGEIVAYSPIEWVPVVRVRSTIPYNDFSVQSSTLGTISTVSELYGPFERPLTMSINNGWKSVRAEASTTVNLMANCITSTKFKEAIAQKDKTSDIFIKKVMMGMSLRVKRVYERSVNLCFNSGNGADFLAWDEYTSSGDLRVPASAFRDVAPLLFQPILDKSLLVQVLPVFDVQKKLTDMNLIFGKVGQDEWYAYNSGFKTENSGRVETFPMPDNYKPLVAYIAS